YSSQRGDSGRPHPLVWVPEAREKLGLQPADPEAPDGLRRCHPYPPVAVFQCGCQPGRSVLVADVGECPGSPRPGPVTVPRTGEVERRQLAPAYQRHDERPGWRLEIARWYLTRDQPGEAGQGRVLAELIHQSGCANRWGPHVHAAYDLV